MIKGKYVWRVGAHKQTIVLLFIDKYRLEVGEKKEMRVVSVNFLHGAFRDTLARC